MFIIIENLRLFIFLFLILGIYYIISIILSVAYLTLYERKLLASIQKRKGPNIIGILGLLQPISDALKLIFKESIIPQHSNIFLFFICPFMTFVLSITAWFIIPFSSFSIISNINIGILYIFMISSLNALNIIIAGWSSNSRYAFLGSLRSISQVIAYEVVIGIILINIIAFTGSLNFFKIVITQKCFVWFIFIMPFQFLLFLIAMLAETNRHPFDLAEAESELVSGYNVEHSSILFALFFLAEYANIILLCNINVLLFLGGWLNISNFKHFIPFLYSNFYLNDLQIRENIYLQFNIFNIIIYLIKFHIILFIFIWVRATLPRYRYDQLMRLGWKIFVPITLGLYIIYLGLNIYFESIPNKHGFYSQVRKFFFIFIIMLLYFFIFIIIFFFLFHFIVEKIIILSFFMLLLLLFTLLSKLIVDNFNEKILFFIFELKNYFDLYLLLYKYIKDYYLNLFFILNNLILYIFNKLLYIFNNNIYILLKYKLTKNFILNIYINNKIFYKK